MITDGAETGIYSDVDSRITDRYMLVTPDVFPANTASQNCFPRSELDEVRVIWRLESQVANPRPRWHMTPALYSSLSEGGLPLTFRAGSGVSYPSMHDLRHCRAPYCD